MHTLIFFPPSYIHICSYVHPFISLSGDCGQLAQASIITDTQRLADLSHLLMQLIPQPGLVRKMTLLVGPFFFCLREADVEKRLVRGLRLYAHGRDCIVSSLCIGLRLSYLRLYVIVTLGCT